MSGIKHIASVALLDNDGRILMGFRRDTKAWTLPGGHVEEGETIHDGALREVFEEAGVPLHHVTHLRTTPIVTESGKVMMIHGYQCAAAPTDPHSAFDPDDECERWEWIKYNEGGLPDHVKNNLHSRHDVVLDALGLITVSPVSTSKSLYITEPEESEFYIEKKEFFVDLEKADGRPHKYLRKYKGKNGKWVYIYHEGKGSRGTALPEGAHEKIKKLAEKHGHKPSQKLLATLEEHNPEKLNALRTLANDHGDTKAGRNAKAMLDHMGVSHKPPLDQKVLKPEMEAEKPLSAVEAADARARIVDAYRENVHGYLGSFGASPFAVTLHANEVDLDKLAVALQNKDSIKGMIDAMHDHSREIESAHDGLGQARNGRANDAGGYGNLGFKGAVSALKRADYLPDDLASELSGRTPGSDLDVSFRGHDESIRTHREGAQERRETRAREEAETRARQERERQEREAVEREQRERQEREAESAMEDHAESVEDMMTYFNTTLDDTAKKELALGIQKFFGPDFKFKSFWNHLQGHPEVEVKIGADIMHSLRRSETSIGMEFSLVNGGRRITSASRSAYKKDDGSIVWSNGVFSRPSNDDLERFPGMATGLYGGVENFLREVTANYSGPAKENTKVRIGTAANGGFRNGYKGALVWAKHKFDWADEDDKGEWLRRYKGYSQKVKETLGEEKANAYKSAIQAAKYPYQFAETGIKVTREEGLALLNMTDFDHDFNRLFEKKGYVDIGNLVLVDGISGWTAESYINKTSGRHGHLNGKRRPAYEKVAPENRTFSREFPTRRATGSSSASTTTSAPAGRETMEQVAERLGVSTQAVNTAAHYLRNWRPTGNRRNITMTAQRMRRLHWMTEDARRAFVSMAEGAMTPAARRRIRDRFNI